MTFVTRLRKKYVTAEGTSPADKLASDIEAALKKHFPKSLVKARFETNLGANISVWFRLVEDKSKLPNGISDNDPAYSTWHVYGMDKTGKLGEKVKADLIRGGSYSIKPEPGSHMAMSSVKLGWRAKTGTPEQIVKHFEDYAAKSKKVMLANVDNSYGNEAQVEIYKSYLT